MSASMTMDGDVAVVTLSNPPMNALAPSGAPSNLPCLLARLLTYACLP